MQPQTDEQRGRRACALTARGSISKAVKGPVGGAAQGSADCRKILDLSLDSVELVLWNSSHSRECAEAGRVAWGGGRHKAAHAAMRAKSRCENRFCVAPACQTKHQ